MTSGHGVTVAPDAQILESAVRWRAAGHRVQLVTVAATWGSSPRPPGSIAVVRDDGAIAGSVSGGCIERQLAESRLDDASGKVSVEKMTVDDEQARQVGLTCGGRLELIFEDLLDTAPLERIIDALERRQRVVRVLEVDAGLATVRKARASDRFGWDGHTLSRPFGPEWRLLLIGAGELSRHVARIAGMLDFEVLVCEPRAPFRAAFDVAGVPLLDALPDDAVAEHAHDARSAVLALTHEPSLDDLALEEALGANCFHIGALGSRRSHEKRCDRLIAMGVPLERLAGISAPVGLDIGSRTATEIAVSIVAELVQVRAGLNEASTIRR